MDIPSKITGKNDILELLTCRGERQDRLFRSAADIRAREFGDLTEVRTVIEYSNLCERSCRFCGMNASSGLRRYVLDANKVSSSIERLYEKGRRVFMFQTGETRSEKHFRMLLSLLNKIKTRHKDVSLICCLGNLGRDRYLRLKDAGVDRYILKFETSDGRLYRRCKPGDTLKERLRNLEAARKSGLYVSSGNIIGLPGQTVESIANDLILLKQLDLPMASTSVFIPNEMSDYANCAPGNVDTALNFTALLRIVCPRAVIPTTSSLETLSPGAQRRGLLAGANTVTLHDGTPLYDEKRFLLYSKTRYIPKEDLLCTVKRSGFKSSPLSLVRTEAERSLYHALVTSNPPRKKAVFYEDKGYNYSRIDSLARDLSRFLEEKGVKEGDVLPLASYDSLEMVVALLACIRSGITAAPVDPLLPRRELLSIAGNIGARHMLVSDAKGKSTRKCDIIRIGCNVTRRFTPDTLRNLSPKKDMVCPDPSNPALLLFTSGTTGNPKAVIHSYSDLMTKVFPETVLKMTGKDTVFSFSRMHTSFGLGNSFLFPFMSGASVILSREIPNPYSLTRLFSKVRPTLLFAVPSIYNILCPHKEKLEKALRNVRSFVVSGEKLDTGTYLMWEKCWKRPLLECYGSTEMCHPFISNMPGSERPGTPGRVLSGFGIKTRPGRRIAYRGPSLFCGYHDDPELTAKKLKDGWFLSDDTGYLDKEGFFHFTGRGNTVVKSGGKWVSLEDIETRLRASKGIKEIAIVRENAQLVYYVLPDAGGDNTELRSDIRRLTANEFGINTIPGKIVITNRIPRTKNGKIIRGPRKTRG